MLFHNLMLLLNLHEGFSLIIFSSKPLRDLQSSCIYTEIKHTDGFNLQIKSLLDAVGCTEYLVFSDWCLFSLTNPQGLQKSGVIKVGLNDRFQDFTS